MNRWKMNKVKLLFAACMALCTLGCATRQQHSLDTRDEARGTRDVVHHPSSIVHHVDKAEVMQIAEDVLAKMHFTIEKADAENGVIRTRPLPGAQFFEFWRSDNVGALAAAQANLHSIRRIVQLNISPQDDKLYIGCNVQVHRLSVPKFDPPRRTKFEIPALGGMEWIDLGKDTQLATEILKRIEQQIRNSKSEARNNIKIRMSK